MTVPFLSLARLNEPLLADFQARLAPFLAAGRFIGGEALDAFERAFAAHCGVGHAVGTGNGLDALELALRALDIGPGDEVIVPAHTFVATWLAVTRVGATPVGVDVRPGCATLDPDLIEAAIGPRTRAIMPVHLYGTTADMARILPIARRHGLRVIEDAAQAHGHVRFGRRAGAHGDVGCFSFYPGKNLGALGDAGGVVTDDPALAARIRMLGNYGSAAKYHHELCGSNSRLDPIQALFLDLKLERLDAINARRAAIAATYDTVVPAHDDGRAFHRLLEPGLDGVWHQYVLVCRDRDDLVARLDAAGIGTLVHYPVIPADQPCYAALKRPAGTWPVAEDLARRVLSLPIGEYLEAHEIEQVREALRAAL